MFVDDQARNIRGAREAGMRTHHFRIEDPGFSVREIREALEMKG
jgi:FMN phosphatase YigB (HAD superfamily)